MFIKTHLDNGIRLVVEPMEHLRSVTVGVWFSAGARDETPAENGLSHFLEHMHFKGTSTRSAQDIADAIDGVGGELNAFTTREGTTYYAKMLDEAWELGTDLLSDILTDSVFDPAEIEKEKQIVLEEVRMIEDTPDEYVFDLLNRAVWGEEGLGQTVLGRPESVRSVTRDALIGYADRHFAPGEIVVAAAGRIDPARLAKKLNRSLGVRSGSGMDRRQADQGWTGPGFIIQEKDLSEAHICVGVHGISYRDEDRYAVSVLNTILGSGVSSRLFQEIREKRALCYSIYSFLASYRDTGLFAAYAGTSPEHAAEVTRLILGQFALIREEGIDATTVERAKSQLKGNLILGLESSSSRMSQLARNEIYYGRQYTLEELIAEIDAVTPEAVGRAADRLIRDEAVVFAGLGPLDREEITPDALRLDAREARV